MTAEQEGERAILVVPVDEVTLMEDRARVVRRVRRKFSAGLHQFAITDVAPVIVDKTLAARVDRGRVRNLQVVRRALHLTADRARQLHGLVREVEEIEDAVERMERRLLRIQQALELLDEAGERSVEEIYEDASWSKSEPKEWEARLTALWARERDLREERLGATRELAERRRALTRLRERRSEAARPSGQMKADLLVDLEVEEAGEWSLEIEYMVPNACWRPYHRAILEDGRLRFESEGCIWQNTGEDWEEVSLRLSTQRPSSDASPPRLSTDRVRVQRRSETVHVERREQVVESSGLGQSAVELPELPGIDDAGEALELRAAHRGSIPSDGRPHRVGMFEMEAEVEQTLFCAAELTSAVLLKTTQSNTGPHPILAGPVDLVRNGGVVGRTSVLYVAPRERFALGWGPDPALRVHREADEREPETNLLRSWHSIAHRVVLKFSNLGPHAKQIEVVERVPVSELEKVKIEMDPDGTTDRRIPDDDGFLRWAVELAPFGRSTVELRYFLRRHADVKGV